MTTKPVIYRLNIFSPDDVYHCLTSFEAKTPFVGLFKGALLNPSFWPELNEQNDLKDKLLELVNLEHGIETCDDHILQAIGMFTKAVENTRETREHS